MGLAVAVLAAGSSQRFGDKDKLCADFRGRMLGSVVTEMLPRKAFDKAFVITVSVEHPCAAGWREAGFDIIANPRADEGMGTSVALAAQHARKARADALMIALADMPLVPVSHYRALGTKAHQLGTNGIVTSVSDEIRTPPACFGSDHFADMAALNGHRGARALLAQGQAISCPPEWLIDIDTPDILARLNWPNR